MCRLIRLRARSHVHDSLCKRIYLGSDYATPPTHSFECATGHFFNGTCATVSVSEGGNGEETELIPLAYPYKCAFSCVYANTTQAPVPCSGTNGYCPIVEGMPEYLAFQTALSDFYNSSQVRTFPN